MRLAGGLVALALVALACSQDGASGEGMEGGSQPPRDLVAGVDLSKHSVPLDAVHFDTFTGSSIPLSEATAEEIDSLRDAIPPLDDPRYEPARGGDWLEPDDLVIGYEAGDGSAFAYPIKILNFHEIVNDVIDEVPLLVTYCPLCRSGIVFDRRLDDRLLTFGNTSALYENDLVMFDRETDTYWWQVAGEAIVGTLTGERLDLLPSMTATWDEWKRLHPDTVVLSRDTGFERPYEIDSFVGYAAAVNAGQFPFPVSDAARDDRLAAADEVVGVTLGNEAVAYPVGRLGDAAVNDEVGGQRIVVFSSSVGPAGAVYRSEVDGRALTFELSGSAYGDRETGSEWSLDGRAVAGPLKGEKLEPVPSSVMFWFAWAAVFPGTEIGGR